MRPDVVEHSCMTEEVLFITSKGNGMLASRINLIKPFALVRCPSGMAASRRGNGPLLSIHTCPAVILLAANHASAA